MFRSAVPETSLLTPAPPAARLAYAAEDPRSLPDRGFAEHAARGPAPFARVRVVETFEEAEPAWSHLQAIAAASPYQTVAWVRAWCETEGVATGVRPLIAIALAADGRPVALLPFGHRRRGATTRVDFLGGRHANYNLGLFDPAITWRPGDMADLLHGVRRGTRRAIDVFALFNQPAAWGAWANPFALLPHQDSPSQSHRAALQPDGEAFLRAHLSGAARKKLRSKSAQLDALGAVEHLVARSVADVEAILDAHLAQKQTKLATIGAAADRASLARARAVFHRAATTGLPGAPALELHALRCGDRLVATFGGLAHAGRFSGLLISHDDDPVFARLSPGEILLAAVIKDKCAAGVTSFDLGIGEARYKNGFCPLVDPLFDSLLPMSVLGRVLVGFEAMRLTLKRSIKQSTWAWPLLLAARRRLAGWRRQG